jgi:hypothetical protein
VSRRTASTVAAIVVVAVVTVSGCAHGVGIARPAVTTTTTPLPAHSGVPTQPVSNSQGQPIVLDETALLACAKDQIAGVEFRQHDSAGAAASLTIAAERAAASAVPEVKAAAGSLRTAAVSGSPQDDVDGFLALCTQRGFEY